MSSEEASGLAGSRQPGARRTRGPLFLTDRKAPARTPTLDV